MRERERERTGAHSIDNWNVLSSRRLGQRTLTASLYGCLTRLDSTASHHTNNNLLTSFVKSNLVKLQASFTVILPPR